MPIDRIVNFITSLRLTVVCLALAMVLVFVGTLAQVELGLYKAQNDFFRSFFVYWSPRGSSLRFPVFPGGYLLGGVLLVNLIAAHIRRFQFSRKKIGILMVHSGLILLLLGQLMTDLLSVESTMHIREGGTRNYSETEREAELVIIDVTEAEKDKVFAVTQRTLMHRDEIRHSELPFTLRVQKYFVNSSMSNRAPDATEPAPATQGFGPHLALREQPLVTEMNRRDVPSAVIEIVSPQGSLGTWVVSEYLEQPQAFDLNDRTYHLRLRPRRHYKPFSMHLIEFKHDRYPGTEIPKNFQSRVLLDNPSKGERREVDIYMNNPLRYWGETYYQASYDRDDKGSVLQVVRNPSWLTPYFSCVLVGVGLTVQFLMHLIPFIKRRMAT
jgi:hypothetical protein